MELNNGWQTRQPDQIAGDRRADRRYPMALELRYKLIRRKRVLEVGSGRTVDMSSGGVLFEADRPLPAGLNVELAIEWPALLLDIAPMRLVVSGRIVRSARGRVALRTMQHEFRTQGVHRAAADGDLHVAAGGPVPVRTQSAQVYTMAGASPFGKY